MARVQPPIVLAKDRHPWEQQPAESDLMYSRYLVFRDLGPETDRLRQTLEVLNTTGERVALQTIQDNSSTYRWPARAGAWDRYQAQADRARMIRKRRKAIDDQIRAAQLLRLKALGALEALDVESMSAADIARFVELSYKIETSVYSEFVHAGDSPVQQEGGPDVSDIAAWTPGERRKRLDMLHRELVSRAVRAADDDEVVA